MCDFNSEYSEKREGGRKETGEDWGVKEKQSRSKGSKQGIF